jgi:sugar phosphate isomerase/epimerase
MKRIPIGLQLYSIRDDCKRDLRGTLAAVAQMGYEGVEFHSLYGHTAQDVRKMLDDLRLACCGSHTGLATLHGGALVQTVEIQRALGNNYLVVPSLPEERRNSASAWRETARLFSELAEKLKAHNIRLGYHNHAPDFAAMEGATPFDIFFGNAKPDVFMQLDLGNAMHGGGDPVALLRRYPGRSVTIHLKEYSPDDTAMIGEGGVNWKEVLALCEKQGKTEWYIVEQETYPYPPLECVKRCLDNLHKMGK